MLMKVLEYLNELYIIDNLPYGPDPWTGFLDIVF